VLDGKKIKVQYQRNAVGYIADKSNTYITGVLGAYYKLSSTAHAYVSAKCFDSSNNIDSWTGCTGLEFLF
jgi:predicted porin